MSGNNLTTEDVYRIQNEMLMETNAWETASNESARDRLFWWQGVVEMTEEIVKRIKGEEK